jgi:hypothetical protein
MVAGLRDGLLPLDWQRSNESNLPFTVDPTGNMAIAVATSDAATGCLDKSPCTKSSKGPRTAGAVADNGQQLLLFGDIPLRPEHLALSPGRMTWLLLVHQDNEAREVRCELSRPISMNEEGRVDEWVERIILSPFPLDGDVLNIPVDNAPRTPELDVEIKRRA